MGGHAPFGFSYGGVLFFVNKEKNQKKNFLHALRAVGAGACSC
jgi:hypothetical protein